MLENLSKKNFVGFFFGRGASHSPLPHTHTWAAPLDPASFWIEDPSWNRLLLNGISAENLTRFFEIFSIFPSQKKKMFVLKSPEMYAQKILFNSEKIYFMWQHFLLKKFWNIFSKYIFFFIKFSFSRLNIVWNVCQKILPSALFEVGGVSRYIVNFVM